RSSSSRPNRGSQRSTGGSRSRRAPERSPRASSVIHSPGGFAPRPARSRAWSGWSASSMVRVTSASPSLPTASSPPARALSYKSRWRAPGAPCLIFGLRPIWCPHRDHVAKRAHALHRGPRRDETPPLILERLRVADNPQQTIRELKELVIAYAKQETIDPLKGLARFLGWGLAGALLWGTGFMFLAVGALRGLEGDGSGPHFTGNWSWA